MATAGSDHSVVIDANVAVAWVVDRPYSAAAMTFIDDRWKLLAPDILIYEAGNALSYYVKTDVISARLAKEAYQLIFSAVELIPGEALALEALEMSMQTRHPIYDCLYLVLASRNGLAVVSADRKLNAVAAKLNIASQSLS
jgi:predicted nucleic acid-binding protein